MKYHIIILAYLIGVVCLVSPTGGLAQNTVVLEAEADTYVRTDLDIRRNDNYGCQGLMRVGTSRGGGGAAFGDPDAMRALIRFSLSDISSGYLATAVMELTLIEPPGPGGSTISNYTVDVHRIVDSGPLTPWIEGNGSESTMLPAGCTDTDTAFGVAWEGTDDNNDTQPDFDPEIRASATIKQNNVPGDVFQWDITSLVRDWLNGGIPNHGIVLRDITSDGSFRGVTFGTRDDDTIELQDGPRLVLTFGVKAVFQVAATKISGLMESPLIKDTPQAVIEFEQADIRINRALAILALQNFTQKSAQLMQLMAQISKDLHDAAQAIIRKIASGGTVFTSSEISVTSFQQTGFNEDDLADALFEISELVDVLVDLARQIAQDALDEARQFAGTGLIDMEIAKAERSMVIAQQEHDSGRSEKAIKEYKKAWRHAQKAIKKADL